MTNSPNLLRTLTPCHCVSVIHGSFRLEQIGPLLSDDTTQNKITKQFYSRKAHNCRITPSKKHTTKQLQSRKAHNCWMTPSKNKITKQFYSRKVHYCHTTPSQKTFTKQFYNRKVRYCKNDTIQNTKPLDTRSSDNLKFIYF